MPVILSPNSFDSRPSHRATPASQRLFADCLGGSSRSLTIGLINNMPDSALETTERQFISLLKAASSSFSVHLRLYSLPDLPRTEAGARHISQFYASAETLRDEKLDGMIVTGREPLTRNLADEPYWESFKNLLDWVRSNTYSSIWSCLAAHAAVLCMDGIARIKNERKHSGLLDCKCVSNHKLTDRIPLQFKQPHSRWYGLPEEELADAGYRVLTRTTDAGVDSFYKYEKGLFVFFQGHPEYDATTLQLEYRRDVGRYLRGESDTYPVIPRSYFDCDTAAALTAVQARAKGHRNEDLFTEVSRILETVRIGNSWCSIAARIYMNWLEYIFAQKNHSLQDDGAGVDAEIRGTPDHVGTDFLETATPHVP